MNDVEERTQPIHFVQLTRERAREVEPESVDMHVEDPVPQAVHDELEHLRALHVQGVAATGEISVVARAVRDEPVIRRVVDPLERQRRSEMIAFSRMVVHDVEDHFETGGVQRAHHALELAHGAGWRSRRREPPLRREVAEAVVAPVVRQSFLLEMAIAGVMMHRHQFDGGDAQLLQMLERRLGRQRFIRAAQLLGNRRVQLRESAHVHLVDDRVVPRRPRRSIVAPRERRIDHRRERREGGVVARIEREIFVDVTDGVPEHLVGPLNRTRDRFRVWIHDNLVGVESVADCRIVRAVDAITVELVRTRVGQKRVPHHVRVLGQWNARAFFRGVRRIEKAKLDFGGVR